MAFFEEAIISGFIGEAASRCVDVSCAKIKEAVKNRKNKHKNIESQIYNVIVNVLNQITCNKFENDQDKIYQTAEKLLMGYKDDRCDSIEAVKSGLQILDESVNNDKYMEFKTLLYQEISKSDYEELYRQIRLFQQDEESSKTSRIEKKIDKVQQSADETNRRLDAFQKSNREIDNIQNRKPVKSRTQEYIDKWNANMFLNDFDKRDENAGVNVKLSEVYLEEHLPHYIWKDNDEKEPSTDLKELLSEHINEKRDNKMLLILGQPGIGKSTLITWITANFADSMDDILVYRFASDLENVDWKDQRGHIYHITDEILSNLKLSIDDLKGKTLILDGFDEINVETDRKDLLNKIYWDFIQGKNIGGFSLIITCRENYIEGLEMVVCKYITLQPWDEMQIKSFCNIFQEKTKDSVSESTIEKLLENKEILGIPLILYMVLALNIAIEKEGSIVDVYDKIFSLEGGIYDRCMGYAEPHRIKVIKVQIHEVSKRIAFWMFENNPERASIAQNEYKKICDNVMKEQSNESNNIEQDVKIGNFFKSVKYCEGVETEELYFVHRSIYEYFVVETIFMFVYEKIDISIEMAACVFGKLFKKGTLTKNMLDYLKQKIVKSKLKNSFAIVNETFQLMLQDGMTYYTGECYRNIIDREMTVFANMLEIIHLWEKESLVFNNLIFNYINYNVKFVLNLSKINFSGKNLTGMNLSNVDLSCAELNGANLTGVNLEGANLIGANLTGVNLEGANLKNVVFSRNHIQCLEREYNLKGAKVYSDENNTVLDYW